MTMPHLNSSQTDRLILDLTTQKKMEGRVDLVDWLYTTNSHRS